MEVRMYKNNNQRYTEADRIGARIREIRIENGMSQEDLGNKVGLSADRIQKYENGVRKPKAELLQKIATSLGVNTLALTDPVVADSVGAMYAFFEMEKLYNLKVQRIQDGRLILIVDDGVSGPLNTYLAEWEKECTLVDSKIYSKWKHNFPHTLED